jgi:hypothetical protein
MAAAGNLFAVYVTFLWPFAGLAGNQESGSMRDIYILRSSGKTTIVTHSEKKIPEGAIYMRMPDHNGEQVARVNALDSAQDKQALGQNDAVAIKRRLTADRPLSIRSHLSATKERSHSRGYVDDIHAKVNKGAVLFSAAKIKGTVRLPRVKFARVGIPMELRDEAPSLDFTEKTLKDDGY